MENLIIEPKDAIRNEVYHLLGKLEYMNTNEYFAKDMRQVIENILEDGSGSVQALMIVAYVQLRHLQIEHAKLLRKTAQRKSNVERIKKFFKHLFRDRKLSAFQQDLANTPPIEREQYSEPLAGVCALVNELHTNIQETRN